MLRSGGAHYSRAATTAVFAAQHAAPATHAAARRLSTAATVAAPTAAAHSQLAVSQAHAVTNSLQHAVSAALRACSAQAAAAAAAASAAAASSGASQSVSASAAAPVTSVRVSPSELRRAQRCAARFMARNRTQRMMEGADSTSTDAAAPPPPPPSSTSSSAGASTAASSDDTTGPKLFPGVPTRDLKPSQLVCELDRFIIGQGEAKKAVAIALRNRWRRHRLPEELRREVTPKNILMIGPTGCGKTEIARRLARLTDSPFIKVEATKFTEVGFHGKDVESIITDLLRVAIQGLKVRRRAEAKAAIQRAVQDKILEALTAGGVGGTNSGETFRAALESGALEGIEIEIEVPIRDPSADSLGDDKGMSNKKEADLFAAFAARLQRSLSGGKKTELRKLTIAEARPLLEEVHLDQLHRPEDLIKDALTAVSQDGIVFIDEIDKICTGKNEPSHADASAEGVQRDLLPLLEGTTVTTKQGDISTDHILFIASGAFHAVKPSDLMAELQGRLPIRVELKALTEEELYQILTATENNLCQQQVELLEVDKVHIEWQDSAIREIARVSCEMNRSVENIGARRLATVIERIVDEISYSASDVTPGTRYVIDQEFVRAKVTPMLKTADLRKFLL